MRSITSFRAWLSAVAVAALTFTVGCGSTQHAHNARHGTSGPAVLIDLAEADAILSAQLAEDERLTLARQLYQQGPVTMYLRRFERGATVPDHAVPGTAMAFVMEGQLEITVGSRAHTVSAGQILVMEPNAMHSVRAVEPTRMLLTIAASP